MRIQLSVSGEWQEEWEYYRQIGADSKTMRWYHDPNLREGKRQTEEEEEEKQKRRQWDEEARDIYQKLERGGK